MKAIVNFKATGTWLEPYIGWIVTIKQKRFGNSDVDIFNDGNVLSSKNKFLNFNSLKYPTR
jgi:hypothetical protein